MLAVVIVPFAYGTVVPWGWVAASVAMFALVLGLQAAPIRFSTRRRIFGVLILLTLAGIAWPVVAQTICGSCMACDPWWLEWFWLCI